MKTTVRRIASLLFSLGLLAAVLLVWTQRTALYDWWRLRNYTAPAQVVKLATDTAMTPSARHLFYVNHPTIEQDKVSFNQDCANRGREQTIVLGCYHDHELGIYLYDVTDPQLAGVEEVTAAHETLHAAYERLSPADKKHINQLLNQAYANVSDQRIRDNIDNYRKQGADIINELHSILGTEVHSLPPELEQYYQRYFTDRAAIVAASERYEGAFTSLKDQAQRIGDELQQLKSTITSLEQSLAQQQASLEADRANVKTQDQAYAFNARVRAYNDQVAYINQLVSRYNSLRDQYNQLAVQQQQLFQSIDSRPTVQGQ